MRGRRGNTNILLSVSREQSGEGERGEAGGAGVGRGGKVVVWCFASCVHGMQYTSHERKRRRLGKKMM